MPFWIQSAFAGLWPLMWHYGVGFGCMGLALAFAWFSPVFKKTALWVATAFAIGTACYAVGVSNGEQRVQAQWDAVEKSTAKIGDDVRKEAEKSIPVEPDEPVAAPVPTAAPAPGNVGRGRVRPYKKLDKYDRG